MPLLAVLLLAEPGVDAGQFLVAGSQPRHSSWVHVCSNKVGNQASHRTQAMCRRRERGGENVARRRTRGSAREAQAYMYA